MKKVLLVMSALTYVSAFSMNQNVEIESGNLVEKDRQLQRTATTALHEFKQRHPEAMLDLRYNPLLGNLTKCDTPPILQARINAWQGLIATIDRYEASYARLKKK